jgi:hypothetical protein
MKKLRLSLDTLQVDSFTTDVVGGFRGTVEGHSTIIPTGDTICVFCQGYSDPCTTSCIHETCQCDVQTPNTACDM